jgi:predicted RNA binding protein YcfA (HicA-like mRNA interferase family)
MRMPRKIRELEAELQRAGFIKRPAKGSHRKWIHPKASVTISGHPGNDAARYQEQKESARGAAEGAELDE